MEYAGDYYALVDSCLCLIGPSKGSGQTEKKKVHGGFVEPKTVDANDPLQRQQVVPCMPRPSY